ncbi:hypothetical protein [Streptomyces sp. NPDC055085]
MFDQTESGGSRAVPQKAVPQAPGTVQSGVAGFLAQQPAASAAQPEDKAVLPGAAAGEIPDVSQEKSTEPLWGVTRGLLSFNLGDRQRTAGAAFRFARDVFGQVEVAADGFLFVELESGVRSYLTDARGRVSWDELEGWADASPLSEKPAIVELVCDSVWLVRDRVAADGKCQGCEGEIAPREALTQMSGCGHILHPDCAIDVRRCPCGQSDGVLRSVDTADEDLPRLVTVIGHGRVEGNTFAPLGMTVRTYVPEGRDLLLSAGYLVAADKNKTLATTSFGPGAADLPNVVLTPLNERQELSYMQTTSGSKVIMPPSERRLCTTPALCRHGFHLCDGILFESRGVTELHVLTCLSGETKQVNDGDRVPGVELKFPGAADSTLDDLLDLKESLVTRAETALAEVLAQFDGYSTVTQIALAGVLPREGTWLDDARRAAECQRYLPEDLRNQFPALEGMQRFSFTQWKEAWDEARACVAAQEEGRTRAAEEIRQRCEGNGPYFYAMFQTIQDERRRAGLRRLLTGLATSPHEVKGASPRGDERARDQLGLATDRAVAAARTDVEGTLAEIDRVTDGREAFERALPQGWLAAAQIVAGVREYLPTALQNRFDYERDANQVTRALWAEAGALARSFAAAEPGSANRQNLIDIARNEGPYFFAMFAKQTGFAALGHD